MLGMTVFSIGEAKQNCFFWFLAPVGEISVNLTFSSFVCQISAPPSNLLLRWTRCHGHVAFIFRTRHPCSLHSGDLVKLPTSLTSETSPAWRVCGCSLARELCGVRIFWW